MEELEVYVYKLSTGEEIIAKSKITVDGELELYDARMVIITPSGEFKLGPVIFSSDKTKPILLNKSGIVAYSKTPNLDFENAYTHAVSPLSIPKKQIIMG